MKKMIITPALISFTILTLMTPIAISLASWLQVEKISDLEPIHVEIVNGEPAYIFRKYAKDNSGGITVSYVLSTTTTSIESDPLLLAPKSTPREVVDINEEVAVVGIYTGNETFQVLFPISPTSPCEVHLPLILSNVTPTSPIEPPVATATITPTDIPVITPTIEVPTDTLAPTSMPTVEPSP